MNFLRQRWVARTAFVFVDELVYAEITKVCRPKRDSAAFEVADATGRR